MPPKPNSDNVPSGQGTSTKTGKVGGLLQVFKYDTTLNSAKSKQIIQLGKDVDLTNKNLEWLRGLLTEEQAFSSIDFSSPFCDSNGSKVSDTMELDVYFKLIDGMQGQGGQKVDAKTDGDEVTLTAGEAQKEVQDLSSPRYKVYYAQQKTNTGISEETKNLLMKGLDLSMKQAPELSKADPKLLESTLNATKWVASKGSEKSSFAADLSEGDWSVITRTNSLLNGHRVVLTADQPAARGKFKANEIERSPYQAFQLKKREFEPYELSAEGQAQGAQSGTSASNEVSKIPFRIPRFRVEDDSEVKVIETNTALQKSMADSAFSQSSIEASIGGGAWGFSAGVSGGTASSDSEAKVQAESKEEKYLTVTYNFPRVTVFLDESCLELSTECERDISNVTDPESLAKFTAKYGQIFAKRVQLGGRLTSSEEKKSTSAADSKTQASTLKQAAAASFSSPWVQGSVSASREKGTNTGRSSSNQDATHSINWEARGGDSLLANNPPEWVATVSSHYNWRVMKIEDFVPIHEILAKVSTSGDDIKRRFERSAKNTYESGNWVNIKFRLQHVSSGKFLTHHQGPGDLPKVIAEDLKKVSKGTPTFDAFCKTLQKSVEESEVHMKFGASNGDDNVFAINRYIPSRAKERAEYLTWSNMFTATGSKTFFNATQTLPGYFTQKYIYSDATQGNCLFDGPSNTSTDHVEDGHVVTLRFRDSKMIEYTTQIGDALNDTKVIKLIPCGDIALSQRDKFKYHHVGIQELKG